MIRKIVQYTAIVGLSGVLLTACINVPEKLVTMEFKMPELIQECMDETGFTEAQCGYMVCADFMATADADKDFFAEDEFSGTAGTGSEEECVCE